VKFFDPTFSVCPNAGPQITLATSSAFAATIAAALRKNRIFLALPNDPAKRV
jgi:hypothetical protein